MNEAMRNAIVERRQAKASVRNIARELGISRESVQRVLAQVAAERSGQAPSANMLLPPQRRKSQLDAYEPVLRELLARYPDMTSRRLFEELRARGFAGKYTIVRERVGLLRQRPTKEPVLRFETAPGAQAQMDYGIYDIDFTREGRRRVYLFSYVLGYSRRQYLRFVEAMDLPTTMREHVQAFHHLGGVARVCLYDNFKAVVLRHDADGGCDHRPRRSAGRLHGEHQLAPRSGGDVERRARGAAHAGGARGQRVAATCLVDAQIREGRDAACLHKSYAWNRNSRSSRPWSQASGKTRGSDRGTGAYMTR